MKTSNLHCSFRKVLVLLLSPSSLLLAGGVIVLHFFLITDLVFFLHLGVLPLF